jgi:DNA helicase HerA-like ATPase
MLLKSYSKTYGNTRANDILMKFKMSDELEIDTDDGRVKKQGLRIAIIGESGSGKSWAISIIAEQAIQQGLQVIFIDPHGEYWTFAEKFDVVIIGGEKGDLILNEECMDIYGEIAKQGKNIDFNLREFMDDEIAYGRIVEKILRMLWKALVNNPRPCLMIFEEAQMICPQEKSFDVMRRVGLVKSIVTGGRKFGLSFVLGSQRPAELHKTPLSQCWIRLFGKTTERLDRSAVEDYLKPLKSDVLKNLTTGQFYAYGWFDEPLLLNVASIRITRHGGDTPLITPVKRTEIQQASIEEFKLRIDEVFQKKHIEETEIERLGKENKILEKRLADANTRLSEISRRLEELKDIRDMIAPLAEKV